MALPFPLDRGVMLGLALTTEVWRNWCVPLLGRSLTSQVHNSPFSLSPCPSTYRCARWQGFIQSGLLREGNMEQSIPSTQDKHAVWAWKETFVVWSPWHLEHGCNHGTWCCEACACWGIQNKVIYTRHHGSHMHDGHDIKSRTSGSWGERDKWLTHL